MLQSIHIQNFRCFEDFKAEGFERINLIGGKNNSGKSCLLEAIACLSAEIKFDEIVSIRGNALNYIDARNSNHQNEDISIKGKLENGVISSLSLKNSFVEKQNQLGIVNLFMTSTQLPLFNEVGMFDAIDKKDNTENKEAIIKILQTLDDRIENIRSFASDKRLSIKLKNFDYQNIQLYGDALGKMLQYFVLLFYKKIFVNHQNYRSFLLIDEIENGIHYTAHKEFWQHLFKLCKELNVQVFTTTHSLEMIKAFNEVALQEGEAAYFEMARDITTNEIFVEKHDPEFLNFELANPHATLRGE